jgi:retron-type reverse transcriptase
MPRVFGKPTVRKAQVLSGNKGETDRPKGQHRAPGRPHRPNRRAHDAIAEIHHLASGNKKYHWILEADIKACFDEIDQTKLTERLRVRIKDKHVCALVKAFLKSGVMTASGGREETLTGTPQGGITTPPT